MIHLRRFIFYQMIADLSRPAAAFREYLITIINNCFSRRRKTSFHAAAGGISNCPEGNRSNASGAIVYRIVAGDISNASIASAHRAAARRDMSPLRGTRYVCSANTICPLERTRYVASGSMAEEKPLLSGFSGKFYFIEG